MLSSNFGASKLINIIKQASICFAALFVFSSIAMAQGYYASPANWLYPDGNSEGTRFSVVPSNPQTISNFIIKWSTPSIAGDLKPLIGNIIVNENVLPGMTYSPNEICAVVAGKLIIVDAKGKTHKKTNLPPFVKDVSILFDTLSDGLSSMVNTPLVLGLETIEFENQTDSLAFAYVAGYNPRTDTIALLKRMVVDLRLYKPNIFASLKPIFGKRMGAETHVYATANMSRPQIPKGGSVVAPYLRGMTQFVLNNLDTSQYLISDAGDDMDSRSTYGPEVSFSQPSMSRVNGSSRVLIPCYPSDTMNVMISNQISAVQTYSNRPYLISMDISSDKVKEDIISMDLSPITNGARPQIRPYYIKLSVGNNPDSTFILLAEEYRGIEGSKGTARLHLCDIFGTPLSLPADKLQPGDGLSPSYTGSEDHLWSIATGNVDGNPASNSMPPYFANNLGNEIVVTQSSREFAVASSKLIILRYNPGEEVSKPSPPNAVLAKFDTIVTQRINGWVAAVNDLDRDSLGKDEIVLVNGSELRILRMVNYKDEKFRTGRPFDTLKTISFPRQTIFNVAIADIEGDGLNDLIVTTNDSTYVVGSEIFDLITTLEPIRQDIPPRRYCVGDNINIKWMRTRINETQDSQSINIRYRAYIGTNPTGNIIDIANTNMVNDSAEYNYVVDSLVMGTSGRFIIEYSNKSGIVWDSTAILSFERPTVFIDTLTKTIYYPKELMRLTGNALCLDTVALEYSYDSLSWNKLWTEPVKSDGSYTLTAEMVCPNYFDCLVPDIDSLLKLRVIAYKQPYADTSAVFKVKVLPLNLPIKLDTCTSNCPTRVFHWDLAVFNTKCDTISISFSDPTSSTFSQIERVAASTGTYSWSVPLDVPDEVRVRLCCENSCARTDTLLSNLTPSYLGIIAPNPFRPLFEVMELTYRVPKETNVNVKIYDQANRLVAELAKDLPRNPGVAYCEKWDGRIWDGSTAANGMYYLVIELSMGKKEVYPVYIKN